MNNLLEFYAILYRIVRGWPPTYHSSGPEERYKRLNTFAVLDRESAMYSENLAKDARYKPTQSGEQFYSRAWEEANYVDSALKKLTPALLVWEEPGSLESPMRANEATRVRLRLCIQGRYVAAYEPGAYDVEHGTQRTFEEIVTQVRLLRSQVYAELRKWVKAEVTYTAGGNATIFVNEDHLATLQPGTISAVQNKVALTNWVRVNAPDLEIVPEVDANGMVQAFSALDVYLEPCSPVAINHNLSPEPLEVLDHPNNASA